MKDENKTKEQLMNELVELRRRGTQVEASQTERKRGEDELRRVQREKDAILNSLVEHVIYEDTEMKILWANRAACESAGLACNELVGRHCYEIWPQRREPCPDCPVVKAMETGRPQELEKSTPDGRAWFIRGYPARDQNGDIVGAIEVTLEITERKRAEEALRVSEEKYRTILQNIEEGYYEVDIAGNFTVFNNSMSRILGYPEGELMGMNYRQYMDDENTNKAYQTFNAVYRTGQPAKAFGREVITKEGTRKFVGASVSLIRDSQGEPAGFRGIVRDITERKRAEEELVCLSNAASMSTDSIVISDLDAKITDVNEGTLMMYGTKDKKDLVGKNSFDLIAPEEREKALTGMKELLEKGYLKGREYHIITKDGGRIPVEMSVAIMKGADGKPTGFVAVSRDITERKRAEVALRESEEFSSSLLHNAPNPILVINADTSVRYANPALQKLTGFCSRELVGRKAPYPWWTQETLQRTSKNLEEAMRKGLQRLEELFQKRDGERFWVEITSVSVITDGEFKYYLSNWVDINERKREEAERWELEQRAQLASRLTTVGEMASGIAHEINNPLTAVIGFAQLLMRKDIPEDIKEEVKIINDSAQRVANIVKRLLAFARQQKLERVYADINDIIESTLGMRAYAMETSNIKVVTQVDPELPRTMADTSQLQQVFLNIIVNAETEMKLAHGRGKLLVRTETVDNIIRICFKDDGPGIAKENLGRIFDPFFTTRKVGEGTGLGLSVCHAIVAEHNCRVYVKSKLGKGATFIVELPIIAEEKQLGLPDPAPDDSTKIGRAKILVVDDEPATLELLSQILTAEGHEVQTTEKATDALERIKSERYSLILLDIKLPGMSGVELYKSIEKIAQSLGRRVLFITGDVMGADTRDFLSKIKAPYVAKPFDIEQLRKIIDRMLTRPP